MKKLLSSAAYAVCSAALSTMLLGSVATAFGISCDLWLTLTGLCSAALVCAAANAPKKLFWGATAASALIFALVIWFGRDTLVSQAGYSVNRALQYYAAAYPIQSSVSFSELPSEDAGGLFALAGILLPWLFAVFLCGFRRFFPVLMISLALLVPCFIVVNSMPDPFFSLGAAVILLALFASSIQRRFNYRLSSGVMVASAALLAACAVTVCAVFPPGDFKRFDWQNKLLDSFENISGIRSTEGMGELARVRLDIDGEVDLSRQGSRTQRHEPVMKVYSNKGGRLYLRGVSYSGYENNTWSVLTDEQEKELAGKSAWLRGDAANGSADTVDIITKNNEPVAYAPYGLTDIPETLSPFADFIIRNGDKRLAYSFDAEFRVDAENYDSLLRGDSDPDYSAFVYREYTRVPGTTKNALLELAQKDGRLSGLIGSGSTGEIIGAVREYVSSHGRYSLDAKRMPNDEDFPVWFLTKAESGYCVHYAAAATLMLRSMGVPARYVSGYCADTKGGEWTTVTSDNAHAWAEVYIEGYGWAPLEATPPDFTPGEYVPQETSETVQTPQTTAAQSTTAPTTKPAEKKPAQPKSGFHLPPFVFIAAALILISLIPLRAAVSRRKTFSSMSSGTAKSRAVNSYRYLERLVKYSEEEIPDELEDIALKARFSNHRLSPGEADGLYRYALDARKAFLKPLNPFRKIYYCWVLGI